MSIWRESIGRDCVAKYRCAFWAGIGMVLGWYSECLKCHWVIHWSSVCTVGLDMALDIV
jgi:hypothetical protein